MNDSIFLRLSELNEHDHLCHIYENDSERYEIGANYFLHGMRAGQECVYISGRKAPREFADRLRGAGVKHPGGTCGEFREVLIDNRSNEHKRADKVIAALWDKVRKVTKPGGRSMRLLIAQSELYNTMNGQERLWKNAYLDKMCRDNPVILMSQINVNKINARELFSVLETHPLLVRNNIVYGNHLYLEPDLIIEDINDEYHKFDSLSKKEKNVLSLITSGLSNPAIAKELSISVKTVETHRANIMKKLEVHNLVDLVKFSMRNGIS